jgi:hypothetical protein
MSFRCAIQRFFMTPEDIDEIVYEYHQLELAFRRITDAVQQETLKARFVPALKKKFSCLDDLDFAGIEKKAKAWKVTQDANGGAVKNFRFYFGTIATAIASGGGGYVIGSMVGPKIYTLIVIGAAATVPLAPLWVGLVGGAILTLIFAIGVYLFLAMINTANLNNQKRTRDDLRRREIIEDPEVVMGELQRALTPESKPGQPSIKSGFQSEDILKVIHSYNALDTTAQKSIKENLEKPKSEGTPIVHIVTDAERTELLITKADVQTRAIAELTEKVKEQGTKIDELGEALSAKNFEIKLKNVGSTVGEGSVTGKKGSHALPVLPATPQRAPTGSSAMFAPVNAPGTQNLQALQVRLTELEAENARLRAEQAVAEPVATPAPSSP